MPKQGWEFISFVAIFCDWYMYGIQFLGVLELEIVGRKPGLNFVEMKNNCYKYNRIYGCYEQQLEKKMIIQLK